MSAAVKRLVCRLRGHRWQQQAVWERHDGIQVSEYSCARCFARHRSFEDVSLPRFDVVVGAVDPTQRHLKCAHDYFGQYDLVLNTRWGETVRIDQVQGTGLYGVTRGVGSEPCAWADGDEVLKIGSCKPENEL